jgi:hypothetical protein
MKNSLKRWGTLEEVHRLTAKVRAVENTQFSNVMKLWSVCSLLFEEESRLDFSPWISVHGGLTAKGIAGAYNRQKGSGMRSLLNMENFTTSLMAVLWTLQNLTAGSLSWALQANSMLGRYFQILASPFAVALTQDVPLFLHYISCQHFHHGIADMCEISWGQCSDHGM